MDFDGAGEFGGGLERSDWPRPFSAQANLRHHRLEQHGHGRNAQRRLQRGRSWRNSTALRVKSAEFWLALGEVEEALRELEALPSRA